jgi:hypothetical protein
VSSTPVRVQQPGLDTTTECPDYNRVGMVRLTEQEKIFIMISMMKIVEDESRSFDDRELANQIRKKLSSEVSADL